MRLRVKLGSESGDRITEGTQHEGASRERVTLGREVGVCGSRVSVSSVSEINGRAVIPCGICQWGKCHPGSGRKEPNIYDMDMWRKGVLARQRFHE